MTITMSNTFIFLALLAMVLPWHAECIGSLGRRRSKSTGDPVDTRPVSERRPELLELEAKKFMDLGQEKSGNVEAQFKELKDAGIDGIDKLGGGQIQAVYDELKANGKGAAQTMANQKMANKLMAAGIHADLEKLALKRGEKLGGLGQATGEMLGSTQNLAEMAKALKKKQKGSGLAQFAKTLFKGSKPRR